jgi:hypothetical protein
MKAEPGLSFVKRTKKKKPLSYTLFVSRRFLSGQGRYGGVNFIVVPTVSAGRHTSGAPHLIARCHSDMERQILRPEKRDSE